LKPISLPILAVVIIMIISCSGGRKVHSGEYSGSRIDKADVQVEAYLFDVKLRRQGKPTTIRLDLYQTDSVIAMYGRGYFNKGAFTGRLTADSMLVCFPSTKEFLHESIENLFLSFDCESELIGINLLSYFIKSPDSAHSLQNLLVELIEEDPDRRIVKVSSKNCPWRLILDYAMEEKGWRIRNFEFDDGGEVTLRGSQRRYKLGASVPATRFRIIIPNDSKKITL